MAKSYPENLYEELLRQLQSAWPELPEERRIEQHFLHCETALRKLDAWAGEHALTKKSCIAFFRHTRPRFSGEIAYFKKIYQALLFMPLGQAEQCKFYEYEIYKIDIFFMSRSGMYQYFKSGDTDRDGEYFGLPDEQSMANSELFAGFMGLERYRAHVQQCLEELKAGSDTDAAK